MAKLRSYLRILKGISILHWKFIAIIGIVIVALYVFILRDLPSPAILGNSSYPQSTQIFDRNDVLLYTIYGDRNQTFVPLSQIPVNLQKATIAIEDKDFYIHGAIDLRGIARAAVSTLFYNQVQGGSTLTQQLVKNSLLTQERTLTRKAKEVLLAFATEIVYPKNRILEMYLNQSPYGGTAWGVEAASQSYFNKHVSELTLSESAFMAGLPESPTTYSPFGAHPELAKTRQELVLQKMYEQKYITKKERDDAIAQQLKFQKVSDVIKAPHFVLYIKELLGKKYGVDVVEQGGLKVKTTLDISVQTFAQDAVATEVAKLKRGHVTNGAALVTIPGTGEILAMVGSYDYFDTENDGNVNLTTAYRQPGSSIKPINYALGLIHGYTAATPFIDQPICFPNPGQAPYCPKNYDGRWHGVVQMRQALGNSYNIPAVKMLKLNGVQSMVDTAQLMGLSTIKDADRYGLSLTLGGGEVTMMDMATAFGVFANQGYRIDLHPILKITNSKGKVLEEYTPPLSPIFGKKVLPPNVTFIMSHMLSDNDARQPSFGPTSELRLTNKFVSVKTGTTNDFRDNWTIGYTPQYLVTAWVGNNDNTPMGSVASGVTGAAPIWNEIMSHLLEGKTVLAPKQPDTVIGKVVCATSGLLPANDCPTRYEYFIKGTEPKITDPGKQKVFVDKNTKELAKPGQTDNVEEQERIMVTDPTGERYCVDCAHPELATPTPTP